MSCFCSNEHGHSDECYHANQLCQFSGSLEDVTATPIYVQSVYDAARFHLNGMRTLQNLRFTPAIPCGCSVHKVKSITCKKVFNPSMAGDCSNLTLDVETGISGASFVGDCHGILETIGPDGIPSEKIIYADTSAASDSDESNCGTPIFGTQNVKMWGDVIIYLDLEICDSCGRESSYTVSCQVNIATESHPMLLTNFFELSMPNTTNSAFMPRLTELTNSCFTCRLATNNAARDVWVSTGGEVSCNLILAICVTCEKKITVPVQLCVLSTGFANAPLQDNGSSMVTCSSLFPERTEKNGDDPCGDTSSHHDSSNIVNSGVHSCNQCCEYPPL